jgi:hypothetical protein
LEVKAYFRFKAIYKTKLESSKRIKMSNNYEKVILENSQAKNVANSSCDRRENWIRKWEDTTGRQAEGKKCSYLGCSNDATVGGHLLVKDHSRGQVNYIAPICQSCNQSHDKSEYCEMKKNTCYVKMPSNSCIYK